MNLESQQPPHGDPDDQKPAAPLKQRTPAQQAILFIGSLAYIGFVPFASGTVTVAVVGVPLHLVLVGYLGWSWPLFAGFTVALTLASVWIAGKTDQILNEKDCKRNVIDELPGYFVALIGLPITWQIIVAAFFLERAIDIAKIWPANWIEDHLPRGWGVVMDDVVAGIYTLIILRIALWLVPTWMGVAG